MIMYKTVLLIVLGTAVPAITHAERNVHYAAGFESGRFQSNGSDTDAFFVKTLPDPQIGSEVIKTGNGGGEVHSMWDTKVVTSEEVGMQRVTPRRGKFFARHELYYNKDYRDLNNGTLEKARAELAAGHDTNRIHFDTEGYAGFSIFVPRNFEHETGTKGDLGSTTLVVLNTDSSAEFFIIRTFVPHDGDEAHWYLDYAVNPHSVQSQRIYKRRIDLGRVNPDKGKWTDFVVRFRANPFSVRTNPAKDGIENANDQVYEGNKGILQLWKAEGAVNNDGSREMIRKVSILNSPVGNVPGTTQGKSKLGFSLRVYKYKWQTKPTAVKGPIWIGFDEFSFGEVLRNGTTYADVHPSQLPCTDGCPAGAVFVNSHEAPLPPRNVAVTN
jgi:hypothetical protein